MTISKFSRVVKTRDRNGRSYVSKVINKSNFHGNSSHFAFTYSDIALLYGCFTKELMLMCVGNKMAIRLKSSGRFCSLTLSVYAVRILLDGAEERREFIAPCCTLSAEALHLLGTYIHHFFLSFYVLRK